MQKLGNKCVRLTGTWKTAEQTSRACLPANHGEIHHPIIANIFDILEKSQFRFKAVLKKVQIRFYEELNDFIPLDKRKVRFEHEFTGSPSVKDLIESFGIPHVEIDLILVNGNPVDFSYKINAEDDISVYPVFESFDMKEIQHLRAKPLRNPKFILDVHLGTLAKYMRMLGFDTVYRNDLEDKEIIQISTSENRAILTRDVGILKHKNVLRGYFVRNTDPRKQIEEVLSRFDLKGMIKKFSRCLECNSLLKKIEKNEIVDRIPAKVKANISDFYICKGCNKIYWQGSHYQNMIKLCEKFIKVI